MAEKVYIHELIDIIGTGRARYMQHMTANWCPMAREERDQLCYGVWGTVGSTGRWPEVVNMWELDGWDGLAANFAHELSHAGLQDPSLAEWWGVASSLRSGGIDRIVVPAPWAKPIDDLVADRAGGIVYAHELVTVAPGRADEVLDRAAVVGAPAGAQLGARLIGGFGTALGDDHEAILLWAFADWSAWTAYEQAWSARGAMAGWRAELLGLDARWQRFLMMDAPLAPLHTGRQPQVEDRVPLDQL